MEETFVGATEEVSWRKIGKKCFGLFMNNNLFAGGGGRGGGGGGFRGRGGGGGGRGNN